MSFSHNHNFTAQLVFHTEEFRNLFQLPLSEIAFDQFQELSSYLDSITVTYQSDVWSYIWGSANFSSNKAYKHLMGHTQVHRAFHWLWASSCQLKHKSFFWLILNDILNTRGLLKRRNMHHDSYDCGLCILQREESLHHLFLRCALLEDVGLFWA